MTSVSNKVVWVTGASSGIGAAVAQTFSDAGALLILSGRRVEALEAVTAKLSNDSMLLPFEVTDFSSLEQIVEQAWSWRGRVDILINNAGISQRSLAIDTAPEVYQHLLDIDLLAPIC